ncbi:MAG: response regulator [Minwuia sp.]|nr:response regulator [Minwuia sp.]
MSETGLHILLADDNPAARSQIAGLLAQLGHEATVVENGAEALSAIAALQFDAAILDIDMPPPTGPEIARQLKDGPLPLIGLSPADGDRAAWQDAPIRAWLTKPVALSPLSQAIDTALGAARATAPPVDMKHLATYTSGDPGLEGELALLFRVSTDRYLGIMQGRPDDKAWKDAAHGLKGAARGIGANEVARLAAYAEKLEGRAVEARRPAVLQEIEQAVEAAHAFLEQHLKNREAD